MPNLPVGQGLTQSLTTQSTGVRQDPSVAAQAGQDISDVGRQVTSLAGEVQKVKDVWDRARVTNQYTTAKNTRDGQIAEIMSRAKEERDHEKKMQYQQELDDLLSQDVQIDDEAVKARYASDTELDRTLSQIKLNELFNHKLVDSTRGEIAIDGKTSEEAYISSPDATVRANLKSAYQDRLKNYRDTGFLTPLEYESEVANMDDWERGRALGMINKDPQGVIEMVEKGEFDIKDPKQLLDIANTAKATIKRQNYLGEVVQLESQIANESEMSLLIYGAVDEKTGLDGRGMTIADKQLMLSEKEGLGLVSDSFATKARRYLNQASKQRDVQVNFEFAKINRLISSANARDDADYEEDKRPYLRRISQIQEEIMTSGLPEDRKIALLNTLSTRTSKKQAESLISIGNVDPYEEPSKYFDENIPLFRDEALWDYFKQYEEASKDGIPPTDKEAYKMQSDIMQKTLYRGRESMLNSIQFANERFPNALFVEPEQDPKTGKKFLRVGMDDKQGDIEIPLDEYGNVIMPKKKQKAVEDGGLKFGPRMEK
jgi:hypothetical protein